MRRQDECRYTLNVFLGRRIVNAGGGCGERGRRIDGVPRRGALEIGTVEDWDCLPASVLSAPDDRVSSCVRGVPHTCEAGFEYGLGASRADFKDIQTNDECADLVGGIRFASGLCVAAAIYAVVGVFAGAGGDGGVVVHGVAGADGTSGMAGHGAPGSLFPDH